MLAFVLWPLWKELKGPLKSVLGKKFSMLSGNLKGLLSSAIDDLVAAIQVAYFSTDIWRHLAEAEVEERKDQQRKFRYKIFPLTSLNEATKIRSALVDRLRKNVNLDAARTTAGISDDDWAKTLEIYAGSVLRFGLPIALKKMISNNLKIDSTDYVIDLAEAEPIKINEIRDGKNVPVAGYHKLVILFTNSSTDSQRLKDATKIWKKRKDSSYAYKLSDYDGFKAS